MKSTPSKGENAMSKIPSWVIGVAGASLVIISAAVSAVVLYGVDTDISAIQRQIGILDTRNQRLTEISLIADRQAEIGHNFIAVGTDGFNHASAILRGQGNSPPDGSMVLARGGQQLWGATQEMWRAGNANDDTELQSAVNQACANAAGEDWESVGQDLLRRFLAGEFATYGGMGEILDAHRNRAVCVRDYHRRQITDHEVRRAELQLRRDRIRGQQVALNILGLIIVLLKDLPIWRRPT